MCSILGQHQIYIEMAKTRTNNFFNRLYVNAVWHISCLEKIYTYMKRYGDNIGPTQLLKGSSIGPMEVVGKLLAHGLLTLTSALMMGAVLV